MSFSAWTFAFLIFVTPGFVFLATFAASARFRRNAPGDVFTNVSTLFVAALGTAFAVLLIDHFCTRFFLATASEILAYNFSTPPNSGEMTDYLRRVGHFGSAYLVTSCSIAFSAGLVFAKLIVWGVIKLQFYHGPLYPVIQGFFRYDIIVTVVSRLTLKKPDLLYDLTNELPIMYRGALHDILLDHKGEIEYVAIRLPSKGFFIPPNADSVLRHAEDHFTPIGLDEISPSADIGKRARNDFVLIEGEDIQNLYFTRLEGVTINGPIIGALKRFIFLRPRLILFAIALIAAACLVHPLFLVAPTFLLPAYEALGVRD